MTTLLKMDYDDITWTDVMLIFSHRGWLLKKLGMRQLQVGKSKNGYHVQVEVEKDLGPQDTILAQILLGSDIYREIYNFVHHVDGELPDQWNKLFDKKFMMLGTRLRLIGQETWAPKLEQDLKDLLNGKAKR